MSRIPHMPLAFAFVLVASCLVNAGREEMSELSTAQEMPAILVACTHTYPSILDCPDLPGGDSQMRESYAVEEVDSIRFGFFVGDEFRFLTYPVNPSTPDVNIDAIFFTRDAIKKFAIPWYVSEKWPLDSLQNILNRIPSPRG